MNSGFFDSYIHHTVNLSISDYKYQRL